MTDTVQLYRAAYVLEHTHQGHQLLRNGEVVIKDNLIEHVGKKGTYQSEPDEVIELGHYLIAPGFVNIHAHTGGAPLGKSLFEDAGTKSFYMSGLYDYGDIRQTTTKQRRAVTKYSLAQLLKSGCTTVVEMGTTECADIFSDVGVRACLIPTYRSARWKTCDGRRLEYEWDEETGFAGLQQNVEWLERLGDDDMMFSALGPAQVDTCSRALLSETREIADKLGCTIHIHAAQSHVELHKVLEREGMTPLEFLEDVGLMGQHLTIAHCILTSSHPDSNLTFTRDVQLLGKYSVNVAHCPWVFGRRGTMLYSLKKYTDDGVNIGLGTDTAPQNMLSEMKIGAVLGKASENDPLATTAADIFEAATIGGARALRRDDLGRLQPGAKADLIFVDCDHFSMVPVRDPIRNLVYSAGSKPIDKVMVNGNLLVDDGKMLKIDEETVAADVQKIGDRIYRKAPSRDRANRTVDEMSKPSFPFK